MCHGNWSAPIASGGWTSSFFYTHRTGTSTKWIKMRIKMYWIACWNKSVFRRFPPPAQDKKKKTPLNDTKYLEIWESLCILGQGSTLVMSSLQTFFMINCIRCKERFYIKKKNFSIINSNVFGICRQLGIKNERTLHYFNVLLQSILESWIHKWVSK